MNKIDQKLDELKQKSSLGLMTHVVIGYPSLPKTKEIVAVMEQAGADFVELQIPFSDPLADGPTIMRACEESLKQGTKVSDAFSLIHELNREVSIPLLFMAYYNTVFKYGVEKFCEDASAAGISGLIIPDIPLDEEDEEGFIASCLKYKLHHIRVISPASTKERLQKNAKVANGFVYCSARQGITGARYSLDPNLKSYLQQVRQEMSTPLAVGFGISKKEHIEALRSFADIAVIGSALIDVIKNSDDKSMIENIKKFISDLTV